MFVKAVHSDGRTSIFECGRVDILSLSEHSVAFEMEHVRNHGYVRLDVDKASGTEVYIMNDDGKTIDSYRWTESFQKVEPPPENWTE